MRAPGPRGIGIRQLRAMQGDALGYFTDLPRRYGGVVGMRLGWVRYLNVSDPGLVEQVLVDEPRSYKKGIALERARVVLGDGLLTSEGDLHRRQARLAASAFSRRRILGYAPTFARIAEEATAAWPDADEINVSAEMTRLTLRAVVAALFGTSVSPREADEVGKALTDVLEQFEWLVMHPLGPLRERVATPRVRRFQAARAMIDGAVTRLIDARRRAGTDGDDLLSVLISARDEDGSAMTDALLRDEALTLLVAGHETTANWLAFTWLALSQHPEVEATLHAELDRELADGPVTLEAAERLPYLHAVLEETLRLYPPAWGIGRRALHDCTVGGYEVKRGTVVSICQYAIHRDARSWSDPARFDPERWLGDRPANLPRCAFIPFSDGPRRCIAEHFARAEALVVIATIARRWRLVRDAERPVVLDPKVTLRVRGPLAMRPRLREGRGR